MRETVSHLLNTVLGIGAGALGWAFRRHLRDMAYLKKAVSHLDARTRRLEFIQELEPIQFEDDKLQT